MNSPELLLRLVPRPIARDEVRRWQSSGRHAAPGTGRAIAVEMAANGATSWWSTSPERSHRSRMQYPPPRRSSMRRFKWSTPSAAAAYQSERR